MKGDGSAAADKMIEVLNLNYRELVTDRAALIEDLDRELEAGVPLYELIMSYDDVDSNGARVSFANVAIQYLRNNGSPAATWWHFRI